MNDKTNVMRILDKYKIKYDRFYYGDTPFTNGVEVAKALKQDEKQVFKTIVTTDNNNRCLVFMLPVAEELDLKKCASVAGVKSVSMLPQKELLPLTGYIHGGCSPIGMKKNYPTFIHKSALNFDEIIFSGGKIGYQVKVNINDLKKVVNFKIGDIIK